MQLWRIWMLVFTLSDRLMISAFLASRSTSMSFQLSPDMLLFELTGFLICLRLISILSFSSKLLRREKSAQCELLGRPLDSVCVNLSGLSMRSLSPSLLKQSLPSRLMSWKWLILDYLKDLRLMNPGMAIPVSQELRDSRNL